MVEAQEILKNHHREIAIMILDIVMISNSNGLKLVEFVRSILNNQTLQIIIRSGNAMDFPKRKIIDEYNIHDFLEKGETTDEKLYVSIRSAIRTFNAINNLELQVNDRTEELNSVFNVATPLIQINTNFEIIRVNESFKELFDIKGNLIGKSCHETLGCKMHDKDECSFHKLNAHGLSYNSYSTKKVLQNGTKIRYEVNAVPIKDNQGNIKSVVENIVDITNLTIAQKKIKLDQKKLRTLIDSIPSFIYIKDDKSKFVIANKKLHDVSKWLIDKYGDGTIKLTKNMKGLNDHNFYPKELADKFLKDEQQILTSRKPMFNILEKGIDENGKDIYVLTTKVPLKDDSGDVIGLVGIGRDISEITDTLINLKENENTKDLQSLFDGFLVRLEDAHHIAKTEKEQNELKNEFLSQVSHDIRTPINSILLNTEMIKNDHKELELSPNLESIVLSSRVLLDLIDDILSYSVLKVGKLELDLKPCNISSIVNEIEHIFRLSMENKGLKFNIETDNNLPGSLVLDNRRTRQILINLISNAQKYTNNGEVKFSTWVKNISEFKTDLIFEVEDTGIGIPADKHDHIFEAFHQVQQTMSQGIGLGLSIVKQLVKKMSGTIQLESTVGEGSKFIVTLPDLEISSEQPEMFISFESTNIVFETGSLLIVDDNYIVRQNILRLFKNSNIQVFEAVNGKDAIEKIKNIRPNLVLMDIRMQEMDGLQAIRFIRKDDEIKKVPVIAYTASRTMLSLGNEINLFDGYICKTNRDVVGKIHEVLQKYVVSRQIESFHLFELERKFEDIPKDLACNENFKEQLLRLKVSWELMDLDIAFNLHKANELGDLIVEVGSKFSFELLKKYGELFIAHHPNFSINQCRNAVNKFPIIFNKIISKTE